MAIPTIQQLDTNEYKECLMVLQDLNLVQDLIRYDFAYFEMVCPRVSKKRYKVLKKIIQGKHDKLKVIFARYLYHDYKADCDGYQDVFSNTRYERLSTDAPTCAWRSTDDCFEKHSIILTFKGDRFDFCELVTYVGEDDSAISNTCTARKDVFNKNFS